MSETIHTFEVERNVRFAGFGTGIAGPLFIVYYTKFLPFLFRSQKPLMVGAKVLFDQTIWAGSFITFLFYTLSRMEGNGHDKSW